MPGQPSLARQWGLRPIPTEGRDIWHYCWCPIFGDSEETSRGVRSFRAGEELLAEEDTAGHFCLLRRGEVNIVYRLGDGRTVPADTLTSGDAFGWSAFVEPHRLTASCVANTSGEYIRIDGEGLRRICEQNPAWGYRIALELCKLLRDRLSVLRVRIAVAA